MRFRVTARHAASAVAVAASLYFSVSQIHNDKLRQQRDLEISSNLVAASLKEAVVPLLTAGATERLQSLTDRFGERGRLAGIVIYNGQARIVAGTKIMVPKLRSQPKPVAECLTSGIETNGYEEIAGTRMRIDVVPLGSQRSHVGALAVFHDTAFIDARVARTQWNSARRLVIQGALFVAAVWLFGLLFN